MGGGHEPVGGRPTDAEDGQQTKDVYAYYGLAMYWTQCVEKQLVNMLVVGQAQTGSTSEALDALFTRHFGKTLGALLRDLRQQVKVPDDLENRLRRALKLRNWLAHDYFWYRSQSFLRRQGRLAMVVELERFREFLMALDGELTRIGHRWMDALGVTEDMREQMFQDTMGSDDMLFPFNDEPWETAP